MVKKGLITAIIMLVFIVFAHADDSFKYMPADTHHIMEAAKQMKADKTLNVMVWVYCKEWKYPDIDDLVTSGEDVIDAFLYVDIDPKRVFLGLTNRDFKIDGVYIKLFQ